MVGTKRSVSSLKTAIPTLLLKKKWRIWAISVFFPSKYGEFIRFSFSQKNLCTILTAFYFVFGVLPRGRQNSFDTNHIICKHVEIFLK